jgi:hypothetical protein
VQRRRGSAVKVVEHDDSAAGVGCHPVDILQSPQGETSDANAQGELLQYAGLAHAGLTNDFDETRTSRHGTLQRVVECSKLVVAANQSRQVVP